VAIASVAGKSNKIKIVMPWAQVWRMGWRIRGLRFVAWVVLALLFLQACDPSTVPVQHRNTGVCGGRPRCSGAGRMRRPDQVRKEETPPDRKRHPELANEPQDTLYAKVVRVDRGQEQIELVLVFQPRETRFTLGADPALGGIGKDLAAGDYVRFSIGRGNRVKLGERWFRIAKVDWISDE